MSPGGLPWSDPNSDPLADVMAYIRACEEAYARDDFLERPVSGDEEPLCAG